MDSKRYLDLYWDKTLPVDVASIARGAGIDVVLMQEEATSYLQYRAGKPKIAVFGKTPEQANYKLAFFVGMYELTQPEVNATYEEKPGSFSTDTLDLSVIEANNFAVALLMPQRVVEFAIGNRGITTIEKLSQTFGVSEVAMRKRLKQIRVL